VRTGLAENDSEGRRGTAPLEEPQALLKSRSIRSDADKFADSLHYACLPEYHMASTTIRDRCRTLRYRRLPVRQRVCVRLRRPSFQGTQRDAVPIFLGCLGTSHLTGIGYSGNERAGRLRPNLYFIGGQWVAREARIAAGLTARNRYFFSKWNDLTKRSSLRHKAYKRFFARLAQARAHFDTKERALPRSLATSTGVVMADPDRFKQINDAYGHDAALLWPT